MPLENFLTVSDHNRDISGMTYIYPVVSRRAGGVSIGINLNINNACNWRCLYCQVPNLTRGTPPPVALDILEKELRSFLTFALHGDFMECYVAEGDRVIKDIAFSGNGEPTSAKDFPQVLLLVEQILKDFNLIGTTALPPVKVRLITNGSLLNKTSVLKSIAHMAELNGEVWFKLDAGTQAGIAQINNVIIDPKSHISRLKKCAAACPTFIQTCMFSLDDHPLDEKEISAYLKLISEVKHSVKGVYLYGLARPSHQPESVRLSRLSEDWLEALALRIRELGLMVHVSV